MEEGTATSGFVNRVRERASASIENQKQRAVDGIGNVAQAVRESTRQLRDQQHDVTARYVEEAADQLERISKRLRETDITAVISDVQNFARRQPAMVIGSAFMVGLIAARFLKSSPPANQSLYRTGQGGDYDYDDDLSRSRGDREWYNPPSTTADIPASSRGRFDSSEASDV